MRFGSGPWQHPSLPKFGGLFREEGSGGLRLVPPTAGAWAATSECADHEPDQALDRHLRTIASSCGLPMAWLAFLPASTAAPAPGSGALTFSHAPWSGCPHISLFEAAIAGCFSALCGVSPFSQVVRLFFFRPPPSSSSSIPSLL